MRKGWTRNEIDDVVHHIQSRLPNYQVTVIRGESVARQFGDRPGDAALRKSDPLLQEVFATGAERSGLESTSFRYLFPVLMGSDCVGCHSAAKLGETNGVIAISVPVSILQAPIEKIVTPLLQLALVLTVLILLATVLILRWRVTNPIADLTTHVAEIGKSNDYSRDLTLGTHWPREVISLTGHFNELMSQVRVSHAQLQELSIRDGLTGMFNRRHFDAALVQATFDASHGSIPFAVLLIDLDRFKPINDVYGHAAGDAVLISVAESIRAAIRDTDLAARIGGDEFAVLALDTTLEIAKDLAERIRIAVGQPELRFGHAVVRASCSVGVGCFPEDGRLAPDLMHSADVAMYADKTRRGESR
jgi:diguanylate cyclase (GGDEF)-like protein